MPLSQTPSSLPLTNVFFSMPTQPAKSTKFLEVNKNCLKSLIPKYEAFIGEKNPDLKGRCSNLIKWQRDTAKELMKEEMFKKLIRTSQVEAADWEEVCFLPSF
jgi:hypothetical protein